MLSPPLAHDGTERRLGRPQEAAAQQASYRGKKSDHTVNKVLLVTALLVILLLSDPHSGRGHERRLAAPTPSPLPAGRGLLQALGFLAFTLPEVERRMPTTKPRGAGLTLEQQRATQALHQWRRIEHVNSSVKRCCMVQDRSRRWQEGVRDLVMELCCALHNVRVRRSPWQPMM